MDEVRGRPIELGIMGGGEGQTHRTKSENMGKHGEGVGKRGRGGQQTWTTQRDECNDVKK